MRSLFLKIFLWFWLASTLVAGGFLVSATWGRTGPGWERFRSFRHNIVLLHGHQAIEILNFEGPDACRGYLDQVQRASGIRLFLFDAHGQEFMARVPPEPATDLVARALESGAFESDPDHGSLVAKRVHGYDGQNYVILGVIPDAMPFGPGRRTALSLMGRLLGDPRVLVMRLVGVVILAGIVCYGLARYLTAPVRRLRAATRNLAGGNLTVRVGSAVGNRRDELGDLGRDFDFMAERLERLVSAQRRLLRDISHELRSPLARLHVALELARQHAGAGAAGALNRIDREALRLNELIEKLLSLARMESREVSIDREPVDLAGVVDEIVADARFEATGRRRDVRVIARDACAVTGSEALIRSAIENVVRNAVAGTRDDTVVEVSVRSELEHLPIPCSEPRASARAISRRPTGREGRWARNRTTGTAPAEAQAGVTVTVRDHGAGVPEHALDRIFEPFYRVGDARDRQSGGAGLGLAIARRAMALHGGTARARNAPDGGLIVTLEFPAAGIASVNSDDA